MPDAKPVQYQVIVKAQLDQMAQYGQVLIATSGVMLSVIGGVAAIGGARSVGIVMVTSVVMLVVSMIFGFLAYGYVVNSFRSPVKYDEYKDFLAKGPPSAGEFKLAGSEALLVRAEQFGAIRGCTAIQFFMILAGTVTFVYGLAGQAGI